jgi:acyl-coenzyme A thioesterase PaaI-like protein
MLERVPANATLGLRVLRAVDGLGEVEMQVPQALVNVIGSLHSSGLVGLVDAACLAAVISAADDPAQLDGVVPLGSSAQLRFRLPARGQLLARCQLPDADAAALRQALARPEPGKVALTTAADVLDEDQAVVCTGAFSWIIRRRAPG